MTEEIHTRDALAVSGPILADTAEVTVGAPTGDAVPASGDDTVMAPTVFGREMAEAARVYGPQSETVDHIAVVDPTLTTSDPVTGNPVYQSGVIACFVAYCLIVRYFGGYISSIFNIFRAPVSMEKMLGEQSKVQDHFINWMVALGLFTTGLAVAKFVYLFEDAVIWETMAPMVVNTMGLMLWTAAGAIFFFQYLVLKITGYIILEPGFTSRIFYLKKIVFAVSMIVVIPLFLLFALASGKAVIILAWALAGAFILMYIFLIVRTYTFFIQQKISKLLWFLYLCAVEILPVSFLLLTAYKTLR